MDAKTLELICRQVTNVLTPLRIEVLERYNNSFTLRVVSDRFNGMQPLSRFSLLSDLFEKDAPQLTENFSFDFEAWTAREFEDLQREGKIKSSDSYGDFSDMAARSI